MVEPFKLNIVGEKFIKHTENIEALQKADKKRIRKLERNMRNIERLCATKKS